jgi:hypothetical protein
MDVNYYIHNNRYATQAGITASFLSLIHPSIKLTRMMLKSVDKRLLKAERDLWQRQAWMTAKRIEDDNKSCYTKRQKMKGKK